MARFVISDIHGCMKTFEALLNKIHFSHHDELYLLGDYIDKGKNSAAVLDKIIHLQQENYKVFPIRGNHEENLLYAFHHYKPRLFQSFVCRINKSPDLLDEQGVLKENYLHFIQKLPYLIELEDFWLVHAGFETRLDCPFSDLHALLEIRRFEYVPEKFKYKTIVHGHNVTDLKTIQQAVSTKQKIIPLDNGCVYNFPHKKYDHMQVGTLCALDLDTFTLISQKNVE